MGYLEFLVTTPWFILGQPSNFQMLITRQHALWSCLHHMVPEVSCSASLCHQTDLAIVDSFKLLLFSGYRFTSSLFQQWGKDSCWWDKWIYLKKKVLSQENEHSIIQSVCVVCGFSLIQNCSCLRIANWDQSRTAGLQCSKAEHMNYWATAV